MMRLAPADFLAAGASFTLGSRSMAWRTSNRLDRLPANWASIRSGVLRRDDWRCQWVVGNRLCGARASEVHHLEEAYGGLDNDSPENLISICKEHHDIATRAYALEMRMRRQEQRSRMTFTGHPGLVS